MKPQFFDLGFIQPKLLKRNGERMAEKETGTIDARLSKMSLEDLQAKLDEAERQANVYRAAIDERRQTEIEKRLEELKALGWQMPTARATTSATGKKERKARSCKRCISLGLDDLASGHIERGHDKWLAKQPQKIKNQVASAEQAKAS